ncbi:hypothetical protein RI129_006123 [Pyrocoelia pectoralis]|uniref:Carboxypeptidase n=1 Tax=Pyrocoelia pectoralis TaxID=417401 RepID=A0AAN7VGG6_9COLE
MRLVVVLIFLTSFIPQLTRSNDQPDALQKNIVGDEPLILTPLIKSGKIQEAQNAAEVKFNEFGNVQSYAGYFTVNEEHNSNMFFWFFPSEKNYSSDPIILWLQGGPGTSCLMGLFSEHGPFYISPKLELKFRSYSWTKTHSVIYIDNPVGTGFSFTNDDGYLENQTQIGEQLYEALLQFFELFPHLRSNDFFVAGESYAGKYVPAISHTILRQNLDPKFKINLQGLAIGNGLCDPENQLLYGDYLYQIGLIDINQKAVIDQLTQDVANFIQKEEWLQASNIFQRLFLKTPHGQCLFRNITGFHNHYNFLQVEDTSTIYIKKYMEREDVRIALHVGNNTLSNGADVAVHLLSDITQSVAPLLVDLLENYRVLMYSGQLDIIIPYVLSENFLQKLNFKGAEQYKIAPRHHWRVDGQLAGYVKEAGKLTELLVRNAGHLVPGDQPQWALDMINRFTRNESFY